MDQWSNRFIRSIPIKCKADNPAYILYAVLVPHFKGTYGTTQVLPLANMLANLEYVALHIAIPMWNPNPPNVYTSHETTPSI